VARDYKKNRATRRFSALALDRRRVGDGVEKPLSRAAPLQAPTGAASPTGARSGSADHTTR
jgi:hypothetical protein